MAKVRNTSRGVRVLNVYTGPADKDGNRPVGQVSLERGQELDLDLVDEPGVKAMSESGDLSVDSSKPREMTMEERYRNDPFQVDRVQAATRAGNTPGLANPTAEELELVLRGEKPKAADEAEDDNEAPEHEGNLEAAHRGRGRPRGR